ncbi:MAG: c-type cytochrome [Myxococcales bacterium]|nr:c-type cytochrome [Myxococcales bacterium]
MDGICRDDPCTDRIKNHGETDIDWGGTCRDCATGSSCADDNDCISKSCSGGRCESEKGVLPTFGPTVTRSPVPPPLSGGTLIVLHDGHTAVASDPDRDRVFVADLAQGTLLAAVKLEGGDEPGRLVEDAAGRVHVVLRGGHAIVDLDPKGWTLAARRPVCVAPRGIAFDPAQDRLHVACAGGELVSLPAPGGKLVRVVHLGRDLRDVIVQGALLHVSRLRTGGLLTLDGNGAITGERAPSPFSDPSIRKGATFVAASAWRAVATSDGVAMVHQRGLASAVTPGNHGYGGVEESQNCDGSIVHSAVTVFWPDREPVGAATLPRAVLPIDIAVAPSGKGYVVVAAGNAHNDALPKLFAGSFASQGACEKESSQVDGRPFAQPTGQPIAVAFDGVGRVVVQSREPATLQVLTGSSITVALSDDAREDTGHAIFHANSGSNLACASCHPEGGDDGRTWILAGVGQRRTPALRDGVLARAPLHWAGDQKDLPALLDDVYVSRMGGPILAADRTPAIASWLDRIPPLPQSPPTDPAAVARGATLFRDAQGPACAVCHQGAILTSNAIVDVGTGGPFKVPSLLGVAWRAPFLHDGRAKTLRDRFGLDGGADRHGHTANLGDGQISDLIAYLQTL